jgi:hypothetical protein
MIRRGRLLLAIGSSRGGVFFLADECGAGVSCGGGGRREEASAGLGEQGVGGGGWMLAIIRTDAVLLVHRFIPCLMLLVVLELYLSPAIGSLTARITLGPTVPAC